jgi:hypothetical protein
MKQITPDNTLLKALMILGKDGEGSLRVKEDQVYLLLHLGEELEHT